MYGYQLSCMHFPMNSSTFAPPGLRVENHLESTQQKKEYSLPVEYIADKTDADVDPFSSSHRRRYLTRSDLQKCENTASIAHSVYITHMIHVHDVAVSRNMPLVQSLFTHVKCLALMCLQSCLTVPE